MEEGVKDVLDVVGPEVGLLPVATLKGEDYQGRQEERAQDYSGVGSVRSTFRRHGLERRNYALIMNVPFGRTVILLVHLWLLIS